MCLAMWKARGGQSALPIMRMAALRGQLSPGARAAEDGMIFEHVEHAHEAVRSRSLIESVRLHEHSQIQSRTTCPAWMLLFSMRKTASVLAGPSWR